MTARAFVVAHHHPRGRIPRHCRKLLEAFLALPARVVFVTTQANADELRTLPPAVQVLQRENVGYDFASYRAGIEALGDLATFDELVVLNTSFVCFDPFKLCRRFLEAPRRDVDVLGITSCREVAFHLQSYFVAFLGKEVIGGEAFRNWWRAIEPISERAAVIGTYEIGLSRHFLAAGHRLAAAFAPDSRARFKSLCRWFENRPIPDELFVGDAVTLDLRQAEALNPTHFLWDHLLHEFGIVKLELLQRNPYGLDLRAVDLLARNDPAFRELLQDALAEA